MNEQSAEKGIERKSTIASDDEEIDICSNDCEGNSRMSQGTTTSTASCSSQVVFAEEENTSNSAVNLSTTSMSSACSSGIGVSPLLGVRPLQPKLNRKRSRLSLDSNTDDNESEDGEGASRKEKSLGLLCQRFLVAMREEAQSGNDVHLESVAKKMAVEKRRIYDIVNVMEALEAMSKTNKSFYRWHGLQDLPQLMSNLQQQALSEGLPERIHRVEQAMCSFTELSPGSRRSGADIVGTLVSNKNVVNDSGYFGGSLQSRDEIKIQDLTDSSTLGKLHGDIRHNGSRDRNAKNSLAQLCRRFLMVLLCNPKDRRRVSLDVASTVLIKDPENEGFEPPSRSRCRRLYDIANVLVAMGIIKKVHYLFGTKKIPLFVYCGPEPDAKARFDVGLCIGRLLAQQSPALESSMTGSGTSADRQMSKKRASAGSVRRPTGVPTSSKIKVERQKSDLDVLVAASEEQRLRLQASNSGCQEAMNDENLPPNIVSPNRSIRTIPFVRTPSGAILVKPKPQFAKHSSFDVSALSPVSQPLSAARKFMMKVASEGYQIHDPKQPHAFQRIETPQAVSRLQPTSLTTRPFMAFSPLQQSSYPPMAMPVGIPLSALNSAYSMSAILGSVNRVANIPQCDYRIASPFQMVKPVQTSFEKPRTVLGELCQSLYQNQPTRP
uniref:E2F/DP family winged-helix DNA-binding domain-containing protein n=1 Tax=Parascaris univalens TaxID=6257 RepID=A0A915BDA1_PARUN